MTYENATTVELGRCDTVRSRAHEVPAGFGAHVQAAVQKVVKEEGTTR